MKRLIVVLFIVLLLAVLIGCNKNTNSQANNASDSISNQTTTNTASKITQATDDLNKTLNDLKLDDDTASINDQDYANSFQSTIDDFQKVLSSDTDSVNVN
jgi:hypothetical protein